MKILGIIFFWSLTLGTVSAQEIVSPKSVHSSTKTQAKLMKAKQVQGPSMVFDKANIDIGSIKRGEKKDMKFHFTNNGTEDLKIEIVSGCECTTLDWPRKVIKPGQRGYISALFDSTEKEKSETVDIDINLENKDPKTGYQMFKRVSYTFELIQ